MEPNNKNKFASKLAGFFKKKKKDEETPGGDIDFGSTF